jgi:hypothetical protein
MAGHAGIKSIRQLMPKQKVEFKLPYGRFSALYSS